MNMIIIILCLFQLVGSSANLSPQRYFKFCIELVAVLAAFFVYCDSSERADMFHDMMRQALTESSWERCSRRAIRDLIMVIRRVQRPNHCRFNNGMFVLSRLMFLKVIKMAYTYVNFFKNK
uniref:Uncharacterized protein n=1 Tax=Cacopsylla melanoneura TaxID=428564 RepID=A0A8D8ZJG0_9HEMI